MVERYGRKDLRLWLQTVSVPGPQPDPVNDLKTGTCSFNGLKGLGDKVVHTLLLLSRVQLNTRFPLDFHFSGCTQTRGTSVVLSDDRGSCRTTDFRTSQPKVVTSPRLTRRSRRLPPTRRPHDNYLKYRNNSWSLMSIINLLRQIRENVIYVKQLTKHIRVSIVVFLTRPGIVNVP